MRWAIAGLGLSLLVTLSPCGAEPVAGMSQQMQLDRASEQELWRLQQPPGNRPTAPSLDRRHAEELVHRRQRLEQQMLQEQQRRELLWRRQRSRVWDLPPWRQHLDATRQQRQFQLEQRRQLDGFGMRRDPLAR